MKTENILIILALFVLIFLLFSNFTRSTTTPVIYQTPVVRSVNRGPDPCPFPFGCGGKRRPGRGGWFPMPIPGGHGGGGHGGGGHGGGGHGGGGHGGGGHGGGGHGGGHGGGGQGGGGQGGGGQGGGQGGGAGGKIPIKNTDLVPQSKGGGDGGGYPKDPYPSA